ncbi:MAG: type II toxin-antitoxin system RelE/ParE family toxin [Verrucomicrobia bacterium]|nr:type II toxin-antitoxin system RelE/ParE family toxin [Verrucomicrobiota bacterium]
MTFKFLPPALRELREAAGFYEGKVPGLGFEFLTEVRAAIRRIVAYPHAWFPLDDRFRRCRTHRFPYAIIYTVEDDRILIVSVMHMHRHPESWKRNL